MFESMKAGSKANGFSYRSTADSEIFLVKLLNLGIICISFDYFI